MRGETVKYEYVMLGAYNFEIAKGTIIINKNELRPEIAKKNYKCK
jgi:hypothetical protein